MAVAVTAEQPDTASHKKRMTADTDLDPAIERQLRDEPVEPTLGAPYPADRGT
jgi:hypothetical protein